MLCLEDLSDCLQGPLMMKEACTTLRWTSFYTLMNKTREPGPEILNFNCRIETPRKILAVLSLISKPEPGQGYIFKAPWESIMCGHSWKPLFQLRCSLYWATWDWNVSLLGEVQQLSHWSMSSEHKRVLSRENRVPRIKMCLCGANSFWWWQAWKLGEHQRC